MGDLINDKDKSLKYAKEIYTKTNKAPVYEPVIIDIENDTLFGVENIINDCLDIKKYNQLIDEIENSNVSEEVKSFLRLAATRHIIFNYQKIANYYASCNSKEIQELFEKSALVIIDFNDAILNGYVKLNNFIREQFLKDSEND